MKNAILITVFSIIMIAACITGCAPASNDAGGHKVKSSEMWTWISGTSAVNQFGVYGTKGTAALLNIPGSRTKSTGWTDLSGNLWLFGGFGYGVSGSWNFLNDLWKYNVTDNTWTWVSGSNLLKQSGIYGTKGTAAAANIPGARLNSVSWIDLSGNLWLFGGEGFDKNGTQGVLNDLWKYSITNNNWTWVSGSDTGSHAGVYGTKGTAAAANVPGTRQGCAGFRDSAGSLWLFGGNGNDVNGNSNYLNDLWKYNITNNNWTWVSGSNTGVPSVVYGEKGTADAANIPGGRSNSIGWKDKSGNLWVFGGYGYDGSGSTGRLNDLWKFDGANWTWMSGMNTANQKGSYGIMGMSSEDNTPGAREESIGWTDKSGNLWLFGGAGYDSGTGTGVINDLWMHNGTNWTWVSGPSLGNQSGTYGIKGTAAGSNIPGARWQSTAWTDASGNFWLFGGEGMNGSGTLGYLNDLWKYVP